MPALFIAGSHTDVGKTHVACALVRAARGQGLSADVLKPVVSGFDPAAWRDSDPGRLLESLGRDRTQTALEAMSPWRYAAPLAPPAAAAREGRPLPLSPVVAFCRTGLAGSADLRLIEGVGGLMSPLAEAATGLDLMMALGLPVILVGGSYLGAISHTLTALEVIRTRGLEVACVVISESGLPEAPDFDETVCLTTRHALGAPVVAAGRGAGETWAADILRALYWRRDATEPGLEGALPRPGG
jgi:dethiobiotin synthetase